MVLICKIWIPFTIGCLLPGMVKISLMILEKNQVYISYFVIRSPSRRTWPNLNPLYPNTLCAHFRWDKPGGEVYNDDNSAFSSGELPLFSRQFQPWITGAKPVWILNVWCIDPDIWYHTVRTQNGLSPCALNVKKDNVSA